MIPEQREYSVTSRNYNYNTSTNILTTVCQQNWSLH